MYRRSLQQQKEMESDQQYQFLQRFSSLPVMETAASQLASIYTSTKSKSSVLKYTLEVTEYGVGKVVTTTKPIVERLEKPIGSLDNFACSQLTKLESSYPIIGKPTEEVFEETKSMYNSAVGPTVARVGSVKDYSVNKVTSVKDYGVNTVSAVKDYSVNAVTGVKNYTVGKLGTVTRYGVDKLNYALDTPYGKAVIDCVDGLLDNTEKYVDYYLPENEEKEGKKDLEQDTNPLRKTVNLSNKVRLRMYSKAMRDFHNVQKRSKETVDNMTFTVDLIQYAKKHLDGMTGGVTDRMVSAKEKLAHIWEEINKTEEQVASDETNDSSKPVQVNAVLSREEIDRLTMERRLIATARHLTLRLKRGVNTASGTITTVSGRVLPSALQERLSQALKYTDDLYNSFAKANNLQELPTNLLDQVRDKLGYITESVSFATEYVTTLSVVDWLAQSLNLKKIDAGKKNQEAVETEVKEKDTPASVPASATEEKKDDKPEMPKPAENDKKKIEQTEQPKVDKNKPKKSKKQKEKEPAAAAPAQPPAPVTNGTTNGTDAAPKPSVENQGAPQASVENQGAPQPNGQ